MEVSELWERLTGKIDFVTAGLVALLILNLSLGLFFLYSYLTPVDFHEQHGISAVDDYLELQDEVGELPEIDEVDDRPLEEPEEFPERYAELEETELFISLPRRLELGIGVPPEEPVVDTPVEEPEVDEKPRIEGYRVLGRIISEETENLGIIEEIETEETYIARPGSRLGRTEITVEAVTDTAVWVTKPDHRKTDLRLQMDRISEDIRDVIDFHR